MELARTASLIAATLTAGLMAGLFFAFSYSVMPGLARTQDRTFVEAMQRINVAIVNVWFAVCFFGAMVFGLLAVVLHFGGGGVFGWLLAGVVLYLATLVITVRFNIPLNNALDAAGLDSADEVGAARRGFEAAWVRWNVVRVVTSLGAFVCLVAALVVR